MKKILFLFAFLALAPLTLLGVASYKTIASIESLRHFQECLRSQDLSQVSKLVATKELKVSNGSLIYVFGNLDITKIALGQPEAFKMFEFYLTDPSRFKEDKIIFPSGYFYHRGPQIVYAKFF